MKASQRKTTQKQKRLLGMTHIERHGEAEASSSLIFQAVPVFGMSFDESGRNQNSLCSLVQTANRFDPLPHRNHRTTVNFCHFFKK